MVEMVMESKPTKTLVKEQGERKKIMDLLDSHQTTSGFTPDPFTG